MAMRLLFILLLAALASPALAADAQRGRVVYERVCWWCHGADGAGDGPAAAYLNPPPRDLTMGMYKWKSTPFDEYAPLDADFERTIAGPSHSGLPGWDGLAGTSMPGFAGALGKAERDDVTAYVKSLGWVESPEKPPVAMPKARPDLARGRELFKDRCSECHGLEGRGDASKKLRDDWGARTWPRDLTKPWTFRAGSSPASVYERVTVGIPGTQMPSFADPVSKKAMTDGERLDVAHYAATLAEPERRPGPGAVLRAVKVDRLPDGPTEGAWERAGKASYFLFPQMAAPERAYTPSLDSMTVRALYDARGLAFLLEWDDPTNSRPWDDKAREIADGELFPDAVAVQLPAMSGGGRPYFGMGGPASPVVIWHWQGPKVAGEGQSVKAFEGRGAGRLRVTAQAGVSAEGAYDNGRWQVVLKGPLGQGVGQALPQEGFIPVAFAAWDGSNGDSGSRHVMTGWEWATAEDEGAAPAYAWPVAVGVMVFAAEMLWLFSVRRRKA